MIVRAALDLAVARKLVDPQRRPRQLSARRRPPTRARSTVLERRRNCGRSWTAARHHRLYPALHLAAHTGMRRGEIVGLKWSDLDRTASRLSISRTLQNVGGRPVEFGVKTRTSRRTVDLDDTHHADSSTGGAVVSSTTDSPTDPTTGCSATPRGRFLNPESVSQLFDRIVRRAELPRIRFHDLRHTHASLLVAAGVPIKVVSERLGHAHPAFTMHTYQHLLPGMSAAAAEQFAALIASVNPVDVYRLDSREHPGQRLATADEPVDDAGDALHRQDEGPGL